MTRREFLAEAPPLEDPSEVLVQLALQSAVPGDSSERAFLNAADSRHRWARRLFRSVDEEFRFKVVWVASLVRERLGPPHRGAFAALPRRVVAHRAAGWFVRGRVAYVYLQVLRGLLRPRLRVGLGAYWAPEPVHARVAAAWFGPMAGTGEDEPFRMMITDGLALWVANRPGK